MMEQYFVVQNGIKTQAAVDGGVYFEVKNSFRPFILTVDSGADARYTIPTLGTGYNYSVNTSDGQFFNGVTGNQLILFPLANTLYDIEIRGLFPQIFVNNNAERLKVKDVKQWGDVVWRSFYAAFYRCSNSSLSATDFPNVGNVENFSFGFRGCSGITYIDSRRWDFSNAKYFGATFGECSAMFVDLTGVDFSKVENLNEFCRDRGASIIGLSGCDLSSLISASQMIWANPRWNLTNGSNVVKLNTSSALTNIAGVIGGQSPYTNGVTDFEITDCSGVTNTTLAFNGASGLTRLIPTNLPTSFNIASTALTGIGIDNLADSVADLTGKPSQTCTMGATKIASCDTSKWANKNWTLI